MVEGDDMEGGSNEVEGTGYGRVKKLVTVDGKRYNIEK